METSCYIHWIRISFLSVVCFNSFCFKHFLFIDTFTWEEIEDFPTGDGNYQPSKATAVPYVRAGHTAAAVGTRMYIWGGQDGYKERSIKQVSMQKDGSHMYD